MPRIPVSAPRGARRVVQSEGAIRELQKIGPEPWLYVGTYPDDPFTRFESPPWLNGFGSVLPARVRFRWGFDGRLEFDGKYDLITGSPVSGDLAYVLPDDWLGDTFDFKFPVELDTGVWGGAVQTVDGVTGEIRIFWPTVADPIP